MAMAKSKKTLTVLLIVLVIAAAVAASVMLTRSSKREGPQVVLVGMDALTWDIMDPLLDQGKLPNFRALMDRGVHGHFKTMRSTYISASIWTTIVTGKHPKHHGIEGFFTTRGFPVNSSDRTTKYLAQILSDNGVPTASVGFWATWPAEEINGWVVSDLASYGRFKDASSRANQTVEDYSYLTQVERVTWPEKLAEEIEPLMLAPDEVPRDIYEKTLPMTDEQWESFQKIDRVSRKDELSLLKFSVVTDLNFHRVGNYLIDEYGPEAYMVYFQGPDILEHFFWKYMEPEGMPVNDDEVALYGNAIRDYYMFMDEILGEIVEMSAEDALIMVCSDHGQKKVREWGQDGLHSGEHRISKPPGVIIMAGPGIKTIPDRKTDGMVVYDVVPTLLYLRGMPIGEDMDGKIFVPAIKEQFLENNSVKFIPTYDEESEEKPKVRSPLDDDIKDRLRALGYID